MTSKRTKYLVAATLITFFNIGVYFALDIKQFLADRYLHYFNITPQDVEHIESNICITTTIVSIFMGMIIKRFSPSLVCMLSNFGLFLITIAIFIAVDSVNFFAILVIASVRGIMLEGIFLAQATLTVDLFTGQSLSMIMGLAQVANSLTTAISSTFTPKIFVWSRDVPFCFFVGSLVVCAGTILTLIWWFLDILGWGKDISLNRSDKEDHENLAEGGEKQEGGLKDQHLVDDGSEKAVSAVDDKKDTAYSDLWDFNIWLNCFNYALGTTSEVIFCSFGNELFVRRFGFGTEKAGLAMSLIPLATIPFTPLYSVISIRYGKKTPLVIIGYAMAAASFIFISILPKRLDSLWQLAFPFFLYAQFLSISHTFLYTNIGLVSSSRIVSVAFSISSMFFGAFYVTETNLFGILLKPDTAGVYQLSLLIIAGLHIAGFFVSCLVFWIDMRRGKILYLPENSQEVLGMKKKIDKGYKWFKKNYLRRKKEDALAGDFLKNSSGKRTLLTLSDQKGTVQEKESLN